MSLLFLVVDLAWVVKPEIREVTWMIFFPSTLRAARCSIAYTKKEKKKEVTLVQTTDKRHSHQ